MNEFSNAPNDKINVWHNCRIGQATVVLTFTGESANVIGYGGTTKRLLVSVMIAQQLDCDTWVIDPNLALLVQYLNIDLTSFIHKN